jgi:hypothetical protein
MNENFTVAEGIKVQTQQLKQWESVLKPEISAKLNEIVTSKNHLAKTGYDVFRGVDIDMVIANQLMIR